MTLSVDTRSPNVTWVRALERTASIPKRPDRLFPNVIGELAGRAGDAPALLSEEGSLSYRQLWEQGNRYARWALEYGIGKGDVVGLMMPNCPDYMAIWLGLSQLGVVVALLNTNLIGAGLRHSIDVARPQQLIVAAELCGQLEAALTGLEPQPTVWIHGGPSRRLGRIDALVASYAGTAPTGEGRPTVSIGDTALYIYTSGTTGLPKAARVSHFRVMQWSHWFAGILDAGSGDRMYNCLPMYHSVGGVVANGAVLAGGGSVVLRKKFSAREFWKDIVRWECTLFQYIGELCRYLLHADPVPEETQHRIRMCCGNGLRPEIWERFADRFRMPRILEFYASTEGNLSLFNVEGKPGSIGRIPPFLRHRFPVALVECGPGTETPIRDAGGFCRRSAPNQTGEAIARISTDLKNPVAGFEGYTSKAASEEKILRNVFEQGDAWFLTGDLMRKDAKGYFYFVDRIGDTFRWKGENVSASEVSAAVLTFTGVLDAQVYGVAVPGTDGRVGMAAIVTDREIALVRLRDHLKEHLPAYARPVFLRFSAQLAMTGTFKHTKTELVRDGCNPRATGDAVWFDHPQRNEYVPFDDVLYDRLTSGRLRL